MLDKYFVKPQTVDRVRACWIGAEIERYVEGTVNLSNPRAIFAGSPPRFTRSRVTYEAYVVSSTSTRPQVDSAEGGGETSLGHQARHGGQRVRSGSESVFGLMMKHDDFVLSDVNAGDLAFYLAGAKVLNIIPFGPPVGTAANITLVGYNHKASIGLAVDVAAVRDLNSLVACMREGLDAVVALGDGSQR